MPHRKPAFQFIALMLVIWITASVVIIAPIIIEGLSLLMLPLSIAVIYRWGPATWYWMTHGIMEEKHILAATVVVLAAAAGYTSVFRLTFRWLGSPEWLRDTPWAGFPIYLTCTILGLLLVATRREGYDPPLKTLVWAFGIVSVIVLGLGVLARQLLGYLNV
jgi:hypothetical protein